LLRCARNDGEGRFPAPCGGPPLSPRHCEESSTRQSTLPRRSAVIARPMTESEVDCFAALATTVKESWLTRFILMGHRPISSRHDFLLIHGPDSQCSIAVTIVDMSVAIGRRGILFLAVLLASGAVAAQVPFRTDLLRDPIWNDGKAEYDVYDAQIMREGSLRPGRVIHIWVKEPFDAKLRVKSNGAGDYEVIKLNQVIDVQTGIYGVHQMYSGFWKRDDGELLKFSMSSNDSCGNTFKLGWLMDGMLRLTYHTYWDGEGDGVVETKLPEGALFYDELPFKCRLLNAGTQPAEYRVMLYPTLIGSKLGKPEFAPATIRVESLGVSGDEKIVVRHAGGTDELVYDGRFPYVLKSWKQFDLSTLTLHKAMRIKYWELNKPGDERRLE
jgi:hypothetical protein